MRNVTVTVHFQALTDLVAYLNSQTQAHIDALTTTVEELNDQLKRSNAGLKGSVDNQ